MEDTSTSETSVNVYQLHDEIFQKNSNFYKRRREPPDYNLKIATVELMMRKFEVWWYVVHSNHVHIFVLNTHKWYSCYRS